MAAKSTKKRNKALDALESLRAKGATAATFHPDGSLASVTLAPAPMAEAPQAKSVVREILDAPKWPKTDLDALDDLPSFDEAEQN